jgi:outer membrane protein TolC
VSTIKAQRHLDLALITGILMWVAGCAAAQPRLWPGTRESTASSRPTASTVTMEAPFRVASHPLRSDDTATLLGETWTPASLPHSSDSLESSGLPEGGSSFAPRDATTPPSNFRDLTESEMLSLALASSPVLKPLGLRILEHPGTAKTVYDPAITASDPFFGPQAALAEFDSRLSASINSQNNDRVFNNAILGGAVQELVQDLAHVDAGLEKRSLSGGVWQLAWDNRYDANNRGAANRFPNYYEAQLEAGVRQPLLRGAGREFNLIAGPNARPGFNFSNGILIARLNDQISDAEFEIQLQSFVRDLFTAYWDLVRLYRNYESVTAARDLAYQTWQSVRAKNRANLAGGEANKEAQARAKYYGLRREAQVALGGQSGLYVAERQLRNMIGLPIVDGEVLRPVDKPADVRVVFDFDSLVARAMSERVELQRQSLRLRKQQLRLVAAKNFLLPQMDAISRYRLRGFGDDLTGGGPRFASAYDDFFSLDHQEWEFGLEMGVVAGRRQARAAVRNASLQVKREQAVLYEQQRTVSQDVGDAVADVGSSFATLESSAAQVAAARERLRASEVLFASDKIQIEFLLDAQEDLLRAEVQWAADLTRYSLSLVNVNYAAGSLLNDLGVQISESCNETLIGYSSHPGQAESR